MTQKNNHKILYVVNSSEFFVCHRMALAHAVRKEGFDVHVAVPLSSNKEKIGDYGFDYHEYYLNRKSLNPLSEIKSIISLYRIYNKLKPDIVHHHTIKPVLYGSLIARIKRNMNVVNSITGLGYVFTEKGLLLSIFKRLIINMYRYVHRFNYSRIIFENSDDCEYFIESGIIPAQKAVIIKGEGVDIRRYIPRDEEMNTPIVLLASRMLWHKGIREFVEAARILKERQVSAKFILIGSVDTGNPTAISREQLKIWESSGVVEWWGYKDDMSAMLQCASIVCLPSYREGAPKVLIEAAACGKAIVTTNAPGCREIVHDQKNGLLVPVRDSVALAEALQKLILDKELRKEMGYRGREIVEQEFADEIVNNKTINVYNELLSTKNSLV